MADNTSFGRGNIWAVLKELFDMLTNAVGTALATKGAVPVVITKQVAALTGDVDIVTPYKIRVIDAWALPTAASAGATVQVKNAANAITDAMAVALDATLVRPTTIDDAQMTITAGGTLRITGANAASAIVYVLALRVA